MVANCRNQVASDKIAERKARHKGQGRRGRLASYVVRQAVDGEPSEGA